MGIPWGTSKIELGTLERSTEREKEVHGYQSEIKSMMYACGDVRVPDKNSSIYLEQIVYVQMKILLEKSYAISRLRNSKTISIEDIVFVLRKNAYRIKKLSNYILFKDIRNKVNKEVVTLGATKETKLKYDWLPKNIYERESEVEERLLVINRMTENMSKEEYLDFTECRQASFTFRKSKRFKDFLDTEHKIKDDVLDILGFIACEIVFDIVSQACEVSVKKREAANRISGVENVFRVSISKAPITLFDIDESCQILKEKKILY